MYINGEWVDSESGRFREVTNPATGEPIAEVPIALEDEVNRAVEAAEKAFKEWREIPLRDRIQYVYRLKYKFEEHLEELSRILVQDHGRTYNEAVGSIRRSIENIESACAAAYTVAKGEHVDQIARGIDQTLILEPLGPFAIITPYNIPVHAWSSFVPYALALGCTVVVSPATACPVIANWVFKVTEEAGFPPGVANLIYGGREVNSTLVTHPKIQGLGFIGSTKVGKELYKLTAEHGKRASINGGAKNQVVVMPDADLEVTVSRLLRAFYGMTGQRCLGSDILIIVGDIYETVKKRFIELSAGMKLGYGLDEEVELGPLTTIQAKQRVLSFIEKGVEEGAKLVLDGRNPKLEEKYAKGYFVGPTVFDDVTPDMWIAKEESFGPIAGIMKVESLDEAIDIVNNSSSYGHSASIFTSNINHARDFRRGVNVGNVGINVAIAQPYAFFPLGSRKESFFGGVHSRIDTVRLFTDVKIVVTWRY
jgi:malonate-semialdehyde dehydrogenase (acetylating)/methylmalonate-semialdehyde dehydrogenase